MSEEPHDTFFLCEHAQSPKQEDWFNRKQITTVMIPIIAGWGFRFCKEKARKTQRNLVVLNFLYSIPLTLESTMTTF